MNRRFSLLPPPMKAVVFDAVGTLLSPHPPAAETYAAVGKRFGSQLTTETIVALFKRAFQRQDDLDRQANLVTDELRERRRWREIVSETLTDLPHPEEAFEELFAHFARSTNWQIAPGGRRVIEELARNGYELGLASNFDSRLRKVVSDLEPLKGLSQLVISSEIGYRKPSGHFFKAVAQAFELPASAIAFVGDDPANDWQGARDAGFLAILFDPENRFSDIESRIQRLDELLD